MKIVRCKTVCIIQYCFVKTEEKQEYCMRLAYVCRKIPIKDKKWLDVSRNEYWAEQMTGLGG